MESVFVAVQGVVLCYMYISDKVTFFQKEQINYLDWLDWIDLSMNRTFTLFASNKIEGNQVL